MMTPSARTKTALIVGAGPAGLAAAHELLSRTDYRPIVIDLDDQVGGLSKTVNYRGNRIDIGGHRFFTKSDRVEKWWLQFLKIQDDQMRVCSRLSRILFLGKLFAYPVELSLLTLSNLGVFRSARIVKSYLSEKVRPRKQILNLEDFFISRFGKELYQLFFESYTEKVWGVPCRNIKPDWGAQRVKGLSMLTTVWDALTKKLRVKFLRGKKIETSLIESFLYPKFGPGQLWEKVAEEVTRGGGEIKLKTRFKSVRFHEGEARVKSVEFVSKDQVTSLDVDLVISSMPMSDLIRGFGNQVPSEVRAVAEGLCYRDFITVGVLAKKSAVRNKLALSNLKDNWLYIQEPHVKVGRIQLFNNWSKDLVQSSDKVWFGMEYFCQEGDDFWRRSDTELKDFAVKEAIKLGLIEEGAMEDCTVVRAPKAYPAYFGSYERLPELQRYLDAIPNLYLIGRNGMHRYNNSDHSILTAMVAVDELLKPNPDKRKVWSVNVEQEYHEAKSAEA